MAFSLYFVEEETETNSFAMTVQKMTSQPDDQTRSLMPSLAVEGKSGFKLSSTISWWHNLYNISKPQFHLYTIGKIIPAT